MSNITIVTISVGDESLTTFFGSSLVSLCNFIGWQAGSQNPLRSGKVSSDPSTSVEHQASVSLSDQLRVQLLNVTP